ncbi:MAG: T9SS type A sorting domain-containing protein [Flavobacteriales bacterium]|nr:T9SS type A sorting domain-containing protein [Flavobacteriales bacterium]
MTRAALILFGLMLSFVSQAQIYGDIIEYWDFEGGIPADWLNESESGIAEWEYRGPDTEPDNTVCSQGSCGGNSVPIESETVDNGFVIFDSNYWDDDIGPCGNLGSGQAAAPHFATLTTESVDLTDFEDVALTFQQQYRHFETETYVEASIDGGETWEVVYSNPTEFSAQSGPGEWATTNISEFAGGQSDVQLRFVFTGTYYWWLLDDIALYVPSDNDLIITDVMYTNFDGTLEPNGFGDIEYSAWPDFMIPDLNFSGLITNVGAQMQTGVSMNVRITNELSEFIYSANTDITDLAASDTTTAFFEDPYDPLTTIGDYTIRFKAEQNQEDQTPLNNELFKDYRVTEYIYARDEFEIEDTFVPSGIYADEKYEIGNLYESQIAGNIFHSIGIAIAEGSIPGTEIYGMVYDAGLDSVIGMTDPYIINEFDVNETGGEYIVHLQLQEDILTQTDTLYAVMVGFEGEDGEMLIGRSGSTPPQSSLISYPDINGLFYLLKAPMVRMHVFPAGTIPGCLDPMAANYHNTADTDDGSCIYPGCTDPEATNYDANSNFEDGSCAFTGCTDPEADNYDPNANTDDGSCQYSGCTDPGANNYDETANVDDGSCEYNEAFLGSDVTDGCAPLTVTFFNQTDVVPEGTCSFDIAGLQIIEDCVEEFEFTFDTPGTYEVTYVYIVGEFESTFTFGPVTVYANPAPPVLTYNEGENLIECAGCEDADQIIWYQNDEVIEGLNTDSWAPLDNGLYSIEIITPEGCSAISDDILVVIISVEEYGLSSVELYPNPTQGEFTVVTSTVADEIAIMNLAGQVLKSVQPLTNTSAFDLQGLASGVYFVKVTEGGVVTVRRVVLQ